MKAEYIGDSSYYAFGMLMPGRNYSSNSYRYGFNGQEKVDEINGSSGSHYTAEYWEYDARLGRRWNQDPKPNAFISDYACFLNNPIWFSDPFGDEVEYESRKDKRAARREARHNEVFRTRLEAWKEDKDFTYKIGRRPDAPTIGDATATKQGFGPPEVGANGTEIMNVFYSIPGFGSGGADGWQLEWNIWETGGREKVTLSEGSDLPKSSPTSTDQATLRRRVPGEEVKLNAFNIPDQLSVKDVTNSTTVIPPTWLGGMLLLPGGGGKGVAYANPSTGLALTRTLVFTPSTSGKLRVTSFSQRTNTLVDERTINDRNTDWSVTYTKYTGLHLKIPLPSIK
ncbi:MAG: hypothetical protein HY840_05985 [Bacteroidetes bacterium]|nr:hypothetical protein [Bacteroidota bacterium]